MEDVDEADGYGKRNLADADEGLTVLGLTGTKAR